MRLLAYLNAKKSGIPTWCVGVAPHCSLKSLKKFKWFRQRIVILFFEKMIEKSLSVNEISNCRLGDNCMSDVVFDDFLVFKMQAIVCISGMYMKVLLKWVSTEGVTETDCFAASVVDKPSWSEYLPKGWLKLRFLGNIPGKFKIWVSIYRKVWLNYKRVHIFLWFGVEVLSI